MKTIDMEKWDRKEHYLFFRRMDYPHYHIGTDLDISNFKVKVKAQGLPFSFAMTYAVTVVMNQVEAFRYRIHQESDAVPRLSWGKYFTRNGQVKLPFNVQAHHAFVDGDHMGTYIDKLQEYFNNY